MHFRHPHFLHLQSHRDNTSEGCNKADFELSGSASGFSNTTS
jgi:hypothetical protein